MRRLPALLILLSLAPAARAADVRTAGKPVGSAGARPIVSDGVRFVAWIRKGRLWIYDDLRRRRTSEALPDGRCSLGGGSARGIFLLGCFGTGPLVWDRGIRPLRGARVTDCFEFIGLHWASGQDCAPDEPGTRSPFVPVAVHLGTGERVVGEPLTYYFDPDSPRPRAGGDPSSETRRGPWTLQWDEGVLMRRDGRLHRRLAKRCDGVVACAMQIESGWVTLVRQAGRRRPHVVAYDLRTRRLTEWTARGNDVAAAHTRRGLFVAARYGPLRRIPRP